VHRRWRLCAGHVRRDGDRAQPGDDLPRWTAVGEGCHGRGRHCRGTRRRRRARADIRRGRSSGSRRCRGARDRTLDRRHSRSAGPGDPRCARRRGAGRGSRWPLRRGAGRHPHPL
jgi:hypothetical protein